MDFSSINWLAVLVCVVVSMVIGSIWYGPKTFFPAWWVAIGKGPNDKPVATPLTWVLTVVTSLLQVVFLAFVVNGLSGQPTLVSGAAAGFLVWLGMAAPSNLMNKLFAQHYKAWFIEAGHSLVALVVYGAILGAWR